MLVLIPFGPFPLRQVKMDSGGLKWITECVTAPVYGVCEPRCNGHKGSWTNKLGGC